MNGKMDRPTKRLYRVQGPQLVYAVAFVVDVVVVVADPRTDTPS